jgi:acyl carrier protein
LTQFANFLYPVGFNRLPPQRFTEQTPEHSKAAPGRKSLSRRTVTVASVAERVIEIVAEQLGVDKEKITPETSFVNDLGADSLDTVELVMELEEEFDINIPDDAAEKIQTVGQAIKFIEEAQNS